jgi:hypothetical protein
MHWITVLGLLFVLIGSYLSILGQGLKNKKSMEDLSGQNTQLINMSNEQLNQNHLLLKQTELQLSQSNLLLNQNDQLQKDNIELQSEIAKIKMTNDELEKRIKPLAGLLTPDNKPTPKTPRNTPIPSNALAVFLGNSLAYNSSFPHTVIEVGNEPLLVINKQGDIVSITAKFYSKDGKIISELKDNQFFINPSNYYRMERPNEHALVVYDAQGNETLNIYFLNPKAIKLTGKLYFPSIAPIIITDDRQILGNMQMSGATFGENKVDIHLQPPNE